MRRNSTTLLGVALAKELPRPGEEVGVVEAFGLIPALAESPMHEKLLHLLSIRDEVIQASALSRFIPSQTYASDDLLEASLPLCKHSAFLRTTLVSYVLERGQYTWYDLLRQISGDAQEDVARAHLDLYDAQYSVCSRSIVAANTKLFLLTGDASYLVAAYDTSLNTLPWKDAIAPLMRVLCTDSQSIVHTLANFLYKLVREDEKEAFYTTGEVINSFEGQTFLQLLVAAQLQVWDGKYGAAVELMESSGMIRQAKEKGLTYVLKLAGDALERGRRYNDAYHYYSAMNQQLAAHGPSQGELIRQVERDACALPLEPAREAPAYLAIATGFPRSGTTLLDHALSCHSQISVCEETSAFSLAKQSVQQENVSASEHMAQTIQDRYLRGLTRYAEAGKSVVIDKTPILSAHVEFLVAAAPKTKYLFSIRHPYDVAISNWKQNYRQNISMAEFNSIHGACEAYDYVMANWFKVFGLRDVRVCYVFYEQLVNEFRSTINRAAKFLGVEWEEEVFSFSERAAKRSARTPSYANVRKGLSLGVQSSYRNYLFLFDDYCRSKLDPWVEFFGYTVEEPKQ